MLVRAVGTRVALFGDLPIGKLFLQFGVVYRKVEARKAWKVDAPTILYVFARHESVRIATIERAT